MWYTDLLMWLYSGPAVQWDDVGMRNYVYVF